LKDYLCAYAPNKVTYYGIRDSSNCEGAHAELENAKTNTKHTHRNPLLHKLRNRVSPHALDEILDQEKLTHNENFSIAQFQGQFTRAYGLPRAHRIAKLRIEGKVIGMEEIDEHWHYEDQPPDDESLLAVADPPVMKPKGRPAGATGCGGRSHDTATRRWWLEWADLPMRKKKKKKTQQDPPSQSQATPAASASGGSAGEGRTRSANETQHMTGV